MTAVPDRSGSAVTRMALAVPVPDSWMFESGTRPALDEVAVTTRLAGGTSVELTENGTVGVEPSWPVLWSAIGEIVGGVWCGATVIAIVSDFGPPEPVLPWSS